MKTLFVLRNIPINEIGKVVARNLDDALERLNWRKKNIRLIEKKALPDDAEITVEKEAAGDQNAGQHK